MPKSAGDWSHMPTHLTADRWSATPVITLFVLLICLADCGGGGSNSTSSTRTSSPTTTSPAASISPTSLTFASQNTNSSSSVQNITLSNIGTASLTISGISASGDFSETNNCGSSVAVGANCAIQVIFTPSATGTRTGTLTIQDNSVKEALNKRWL